MEMFVVENVNLNGYDITPYERAELEDILSKGVDYQYDKRFSEKDSYKKLFLDVEKIPDPGTSWFLHAVHGESYNPNLKKTKTLSRKQEEALFLQYNWCKFKMAEQQLAEEPDMSTMIHFLRMKNKLREKIVGYNLALVLSLVKKASNSNLSFDELVETGNMILLNALDKFSIGEGNKFSTYLVRSIPRAFSKESHKLSKYYERFPVNIDPVSSDGHSNEWIAAEEDDEDENLKLGIMREILDKNLADLTELEMKIIKARYPSDVDPEFKRPTLESLGEELACSKSNLSRLERCAVKKLRSKIIEIMKIKSII